MSTLERAREILYNWDEWHKAREGLPTEPGALRILRLLLPIAEAAEKAHQLTLTNRYCLYCGAVPNEDHCDDCPEGIIKEALKGLDE